jgi:NADH-quinone oxidoreductase subunit E
MTRPSIIARASIGETGNRAGSEPYQPASFAFDAASEAEIGPLLAKYPPGRQASAVLPMLWLAQRQMGRQSGSAWVPVAAMDEVARRLGMPPIRVYEVATFYTMFNLQPIGRWHLQVCTTTPCWLRGSDAVVAACRRATGIAGWRETSADGLFTLSEVECLGACVNAPILQVNDDFYEDLDGPNTEALIAALRRGEPPQPGSVIGRQGSAPASGPNTLTTPAASGAPAAPPSSAHPTAPGDD